MQDRVDYVEVTPTVSMVQHLRIVTFMALLLVGSMEVSSRAVSFKQE